MPPSVRSLQDQVMYLAIGFIVVVFLLHIFGKVRCPAAWASSQTAAPMATAARALCPDLTTCSRVVPCSSVVRESNDMRWTCKGALSGTLGLAVK